MSLSKETVVQFTKMLQNLQGWLDEAEGFAKAREMDPELLLAVRLYPDQYELRRQIQASCDAAKLCGARLAAVEAPKHEDGPQSIAELRARIGEVIGFLQGLDQALIDGSGARPISLHFAPGMVVDAADYAREFAIPNFYFHITTAYACLRHCGVKLGKRNFIGGMSLRPVG